MDGAGVRPVSRRSTMLIAGLVLSVFGLGFFCWMVFTLAVYALPFLAGLTVGLAAFLAAPALSAHSSSVFWAAVVLVLGQTAFAAARAPWIRLLIGLVYAVPNRRGLSALFRACWYRRARRSLAASLRCRRRTAVGLTAFARMAMFIPPSTGRGFLEGTPSRRFSYGRATYEDEFSPSGSSNRLAKIGAVKLGLSTLKER